MTEKKPTNDIWPLIAAAGSALGGLAAAGEAIGWRCDSGWCQCRWRRDCGRGSEKRG
jgi:hypothetical protein